MPTVIPATPVTHSSRGTGHSLRLHGSRPRKVTKRGRTRQLYRVDCWTPDGKYLGHEWITYGAFIYLLAA